VCPTQTSFISTQRKGEVVMPLVDCRVCEKEVADDAPLCPHCGTKWPVGQGRTQSRGILLTVVLVLCGLLLIVFVNRRELAKGKKRAERINAEIDASVRQQMKVEMKARIDEEMKEHWRQAYRSLLWPER
jgi:hypothetical protein